MRRYRQPTSIILSALFVLFNSCVDEEINQPDVLQVISNKFHAKFKPFGELTNIQLNLNSAEYLSTDSVNNIYIPITSDLDFFNQSPALEKEKHYFLKATKPTQHTNWKLNILSISEYVGFQNSWKSFSDTESFNGIILNYD